MIYTMSDRDEIDESSRHFPDQVT